MFSRKRIIHSSLLASELAVTVPVSELETLMDTYHALRKMRDAGMRACACVRAYALVCVCARA